MAATATMRLIKMNVPITMSTMRRIAPSILYVVPEPCMVRTSNIITMKEMTQLTSPTVTDDLEQGTGVSHIKGCT